MGEKKNKRERETKRARAIKIDEIEIAIHTRWR